MKYPETGDYRRWQAGQDKKHVDLRLPRHFRTPRDCGVKHPNELAELFGKDSIPVQRRLIFPANPQIRPSCGGRDIQRVNVAESGVGNKSPTK